MDWKLTLEVLGILGGTATILALFLAPMFWIGSKIDTLTAKVHQEMKDFHGRLCALEEKNKK